MRTPSVGRGHRASQTGQIAPPQVSEPSGPRLKSSTDSRSLSGARGTRPIGEALAEAQAQNPLATFGNRVVDGSRSLIAGGYRYPPNLTSQYYHAPGKVGCCADFVADSYAKAGFDLGKDAASKGYNPHYCPSMIGYFKNHQQLISANSPAHVGDAVFFDWHGSGEPSHLAIITKVDANGRPTEIMESNHFNQPAHTTPMDSYHLSHIMAFGRLKGAGADDGAAAQLPPVTNPAPVAGPSSGGGASGPARGYSSAPAGDGYNAPGAATAAPTSPAAARKLAIMEALQAILKTITDKTGISAGQASALLSAKRSGVDVRAMAAQLGITPDKLDSVVDAVNQASGNADAVLGKNNLPVPHQPDDWGLDIAAGQESLKKYGNDIKTSAEKAGVDPQALATLLWMRGNFDLGSDPKATISQAAADLKANWKPDDLAGSLITTIDPEGKLSSADELGTLQLAANRYAAVKEAESTAPTQPKPETN